MDLQLQGKVALVTGASQGIGRTTALLLAQEGVHVIGVARRTDLVGSLNSELSNLPRASATVTSLQADFSQEGASERVAEEALQLFGRIDILINAAGGSRPLDFNATHEQWLEGMTLNFFRIRELTHAVVPKMKEHQWGRIITFTGTSEPTMLNAAFTAKAAVHVWAKGLSRELGPYGITINNLQPGRIRTEQIRKRYPNLASEQEYAQREIPVGRFGDTHEIANLALFLASPLASYITGTVIPVDGGSSRFAF